LWAEFLGGILWAEFIGDILWAECIGDVLWADLLEIPCGLIYWRYLVG